MNKAILSLLLIVAFAAYSLHVHIMGANAPVVLTPETNKPKVALSLPQYNLTASSTTKWPGLVLTPRPSPIPTPKSNQKPVPTATRTTLPTPIPTLPSTPTPVVNTGKYRNGSYTGAVADAYYGNVQVVAVISGGKITDVQFLDYPHDRQTSIFINSRAMPYLISEAIVAQDANVDTVSGASFTSAAYRDSLSSALAKAII